MDTNFRDQQQAGRPGAMAGWTEAGASYLPQEQPVAWLLALTHRFDSNNRVRLRCHEKLCIARTFHLLTELRGRQASSRNHMLADNSLQKEMLQMSS